MKNISFTKMSGAGNDFILINLERNPTFISNANIIKNLCNRRTGIGADGLITVCKKQGYDFDMSYYNADGTGGVLCGNGARCAVKFANIHKFFEKAASFSSYNFEYKAKVIDESTVKFFLNEPKILNEELKISILNKEINGVLIDTGTLHLIVDISKNDFFENNNLNDINVVDIGRSLRYCNELKPGGANINFISIKNDKVYVRTYERGVEDETLACGTGSVASAIYSFLNYNMQPQINIITRSNENLVIDFLYENKFFNVSLTGPVEEIFDGSFELNKFI